MTYVKINWYEFAVAHNDVFRYLVKAISKHMELKMPSRIRLHINIGRDSVDTNTTWLKYHWLIAMYKHGKKWSTIIISLDNILASSIEKFVSDINIDCCGTISIDATELIGIIKGCKP